MSMFPLEEYWTLYCNNSALQGRTRYELRGAATARAAWVSGNAAIAFQASDGTWPATLDAVGQAHLVEILSCLERPQAHCPDLLPDPDSPTDLERILNTPVRGGTWDDLMHNLARAGNLSVLLGPDVVGNDQAPDELPVGSIAAALRQLTASGVSAIIRHGVICLSHRGIGEQEHPAERRRVALVPIHHLLHDRSDGDLIALSIIHAVQPDMWTLPGWGIYFLDDSSCLLVAADPPLIHRVLDAVDMIDQLGFDRGIASLKALHSGEPS